MQRIRVTADNEPTIEDDNDPPVHMLFTCGIEVTLAQHLELLASPRKCNLLGVDNTNERIVYEHRHGWYGWPEIPPINPEEEEYPSTTY